MTKRIAKGLYAGEGEAPRRPPPPVPKTPIPSHPGWVDPEDLAILKADIEEAKTSIVVENRRFGGLSWQLLENLVLAYEERDRLERQLIEYWAEQNP